MRTWEANIRRVTPYTPGEQPRSLNVIKLNTNENPYPPSPKVEEALRAMDPSLLRKYPDPACTALREAIAQTEGLSADRVFVGVGSDDVLAMCFIAFFYGEQPVLFPDITYSFYDVWAELFRIPYRQIPLDDDFQICAGDYEIPNGGIMIANPNAPTGQLLPLSVIRQIISRNQDSIVIVDEAYIDFGGESALPLLEEFDNLVVVRTFSKSRSLAGMRIGAAFASEYLIRCLSDVKYSYNSYTMNMPSLIAGTAAVSDQVYFEEVVSKIIATRERIEEPLRRLGFSFHKSSTNFLFVTHKICPAGELFEALKKAGIYVRHFRAPRISNYLRITIGTDEEMDALLAFLQSYLSKRGGEA